MLKESAKLDTKLIRKTIKTGFSAPLLYLALINRRVSKGKKRVILPSRMKVMSMKLNKKQLEKAKLNLDHESVLLDRVRCQVKRNLFRNHWRNQWAPPCLGRKRNIKWTRTIKCSHLRRYWFKIKLQKKNFQVIKKATLSINQVNKQSYTLVQRQKLYKCYLLEWSVSLAVVKPILTRIFRLTRLSNRDQSVGLLCTNNRKGNSHSPAWCRTKTVQWKLTRSGMRLLCLCNRMSQMC